VQGASWEYLPSLLEEKLRRSMIAALQSVVMAALHETAEPITSRSVCDIVVFHSVMQADIQELPKEENVQTPLRTRAVPIGCLSEGGGPE
jgi:hypothetical protein